jgi:hypothetical protein
MLSTSAVKWLTSLASHLAKLFGEHYWNSDSVRMHKNGTVLVSVLITWGHTAIKISYTDSWVLIQGCGLDNQWGGSWIDLHWVWAPMVPMHPGLIDGPFVPHNLISAQESPVPLPQFQMVLRLKTQCPLGPRKEPGYTILFSQKVLASEPPPGSSTGPLCRELPTYRAFLHLLIYIFLSVPHSPQ